MGKRSTHSNQTTFEIDRPSTSRRTVTDCDNPRYDANSLTRPEYDQTSSTGVRLLPTDGNDNTLYDKPDVKVRTWIHEQLFIESESKDVEDEACPSEENTSRVNTKRSRSSDAKKTDSGKLKYNEIHSKIRAKDRKRSAEVGKQDAGERADGSRDDSSSATSSNQIRQADAFDRLASHATNAPTVGNKPSSADTTWSRVREIGKEMRGKKKKKVKKLSVSTERSSDKSAEKCNESPEKNNENRNEKNTESIPNKSKNVPRIVEDIMLTPSKKYDSLNRSLTNEDTSNKKAKSNLSREIKWSKRSNWKSFAIDEKPSLSDVRVKTRSLDASANETTTRNREESFANDKIDCSMSEVNPSSLETSLVITLREGEKLPIRSLNSCQMNEIIGCEGDLKGLVDDTNVSESRRHLMKEEDEEQKEDVTEPFDSPLRQQRLFILTPEKLNESVDKRSVSRNTGLRTPVNLETNPTSSLPPENQIPHVNNDSGRTTTTIPGEETSHLRSMNKSRLSLKRTSKTLKSPLFSQTPLMERMLIDRAYDSYDSSSKSRKSVDSPVSNKGPSFDRLAIVKRDLSSQINDGDRPSTDQATTTAGVSTKSTVVAEDNNRNVGETVCQDKTLSAQSTSSRKSKRIDNCKEGCGFPVKFTQLGTLIRRRDVKYYYKGATKREIHLPVKTRVASVYNMQQSDSKSDMQPRAGDKSHSFESLLTTFNESQDSTDVTVMENMCYVHKSATNLDNIVLETTGLPYGIPASSTPNADADRRLDRAEATARGSSSTSIIHKTSIAEEAPRSPRTPRADQNAESTLRANSIRLLSPDKDSQLKFLTMDSPMSQHGQSRLASSARPTQAELGRDSASTKDNNLAEVTDSQGTVKSLEPLSKRLELAKKRKRADDNDDDNSSVSAVSMSSQCTVKLSNRNQDKTSPHSNADKKSRLNSPCNRGDEVICLDSDNSKKSHDKKCKRIVLISDSDTDTESSARIVKKWYRYVIVFAVASIHPS